MKNVFFYVLQVWMVFVFSGCSRKSSEIINIQVPIIPSLEDRIADGTLYTPTTQTILRGYHWLETVRSIDIIVNQSLQGTFKLNNPNTNHVLHLQNIPIDYLVPRMHYTPSNPPDEFDGFNLMMAEYSRNGLRVPVGKKDDSIARFVTNLKDGSPWSLEGDFKFLPNPSFKPLRIGVINNCLHPGLWEINAEDRAGEFYHGWCQIPEDAYSKLVAKVNKLPIDFVKRSIQWHEKNVKISLDRLRTIDQQFDTVPIYLIDGKPGYSSQGSRRKLHKRYVTINKNGKDTIPEKLSDFKSNSVKMSDFVAPGKYSLAQRKVFDLSFLFEAMSVKLSTVNPLTNYQWNTSNQITFKSNEYVEFQINLSHNRKIILGNIPLSLLVRQQDFVINGFGVGVLSANALAERRQLLLERGPHPSFAYVIEEKDNEWYAINSHTLGIEQVFVRCNPLSKKPHFEITIASFERIVDLVKYKIQIPETLLDITRKNTESYTSPEFYTYRDDNLR